MSYKVNTLIMFADIIGSVSYADIMDKEEYNNLLIDYKKSIEDTATSSELEATQWKCKGDEIIAFIECRNTEESLRNIWKLISITRKLKLRWLSSPINEKRIKNNKKPIEIAIGINFGELDKDKDVFSYEVYHISLAKRIEGTAREEGRFTRIMLSRNAFQLSLNASVKVHWVKPKTISLKGVVENESVHEILCFYEGVYWDYPFIRNNNTGKSRIETLDKLFENDYSNTWLGLFLAAFHFSSMNYNKTDTIISKMLSVNRDTPMVWVLSVMSLIQQLYIIGDKLIAYLDDNKVKMINEHLFKAVLAQITDRGEMAIKLDPFMDEAYLEVGISFYSISIICSNIPGTTYHPERYLDEALKHFTTSSRIGFYKGRAIFNIWNNMIIRNDYKKIHIQPLLHHAGWIDDESIPDKEALIVIIEKLIQIRDMITTEQFRINISQSFAMFLAIQFHGTPFPYKALTLLNESLNRKETHTQNSFRRLATIISGLVSSFALKLTANSLTCEKVADSFLDSAIDDCKELSDARIRIGFFSVGNGRFEIVDSTRFINICQFMKQNLDNPRALLGAVNREKR